MAQQCVHCGKELFAGQRFCRFCGKPSGQLEEERIPTQVMPPVPDPRPSRGTAQVGQPGRPNTSPVYAQPVAPPPTYYQPPPAQPPVAYSPAFPYQQPREKKRVNVFLIVALLGLMMFGMVFLGVFIFRAGIRDGQIGPGPAGISSIQAGESAFDEGPAAVAGSPTTFRRQFPLSANSTFTITAPSDEIVIEGWDQPYAEVTIVKSGGSSRSRRETKVVYSTSGDDLKLRTVSGRGRGVDVEYQVKLPRALKQVTIESASGNVRLADLSVPVSVNLASGDLTLSEIKGNVTANSQSGAINLAKITGRVAVNTASGGIEIANVTGSVKANSASGDMNVSFDAVTPGEALEFNSASGNVELNFANELDADLSVETLSGDVQIADKYGIKVEKPMVGQRASGRIGKGGQRLKINTVSGDVKIN